MKTREELIKSIKEDIEIFGEDREVYVYFENCEEGLILKDYYLDHQKGINDYETLGNLLYILETN